MNEDLFRQRQPDRLEEDRPVGRVKLENVLADDVEVGGPQLDFASGTLVFGVQRRQHDRVSIHSGDADVVHERVEPDPGDKMRIEGHRNAPA